jgi:ubiquitin-conjugating enzyme E2 D/E
MTESRIYKEIEDIYVNPPDNISAGPINDNDIFHWEAVITGPEETDYKDGVFLLDIIIPPQYPYKPPYCKFKTKIWHPNISPDSGSICITTLKEKYWNPSMTISDILYTIMLLLYKPNFDDPLNGKARDEHKENPQKYKEKVQKWVKDYSSKKNIK